MENNAVTLHKEILSSLFAYKRTTRQIFEDVLGLLEINHIAISCVSSQKELLVFSSTPAIEFNLFSSKLWQFDATFSPQWFQKFSHSKWENLYNTAYYDDLIYLKQIKHGFVLNKSLAGKLAERIFIYSFASKKNSPFVTEIFANKTSEFYQIGQYCSNLLQPIFDDLFNLSRESKCALLQK